MFGMNLGSLVVHLRADSTQFHAALSRAEVRLTKMATKMQAVGRKMMLGVTAPLTILGGLAVKTFADFDDAMTKSVAIMSGITPEIRKQMEDTVRAQVKRGSVTSLKDLASAYFYLASAGMDAHQSMKALPVVERFATAGAFDMATATDLLTDAQSALGLSSKDAEKNMKGMLRVSDALVKANTMANATVQEFSEALTNDAAAAINQYNMDLKEGIAILAVYADKGKKGNVAGSMMGRMTRLLIKAINDNGGAFKKLNIDVEEFATTGKNVIKIIKGITRATEGMGPAQKAATLDTLGFQARVQQTIMPLLGATDQMRDYQRQMDEMGGITKRVADKQLTSFSSRMKIFKNRVSLAAETLGRALAPAVEAMAGAIQRLTQWFDGLNKTTQKWVATGMVVLAVIGPLALGFGLVAKGVSLLIKGVLLLKTILSPMVIGVAAVVVVVWALADAFIGADLGMWNWFKNMKTITGEKLGTFWEKVFHSIWGALQDFYYGWKITWENIKHFASDVGHGIWDVLQTVWYGIERGFLFVKNNIARGLLWLLEMALDVMDAVDITGAHTDRIEGARGVLVAWQEGLDLAEGQAALDFSKKMKEIGVEKTKRQREYEQSIMGLMEEEDRRIKTWETRMADLEHKAFLEKLPDVLKEKPPGVGVQPVIPSVADKVLDDVQKAAEGLANVLPTVPEMIEEMTEGVATGMDFEMPPQQMDFRQMSLRRFGLKPVSATRTKKQEVEDKVVANRLDGILEELQKKTAAVLG